MEFFRKLEDDEEAVIDALVYLQISSGGDFILDYDEKMTHNRLVKTGEAFEYKITLGKLRKIISKLCDDHILNVDWIVDAKWHNKVYPLIDPKSMPVNPEPKYFWANQTSWAYESLQLNGLMSVEDVYKKDGCQLYIKLDQKEMNKIDHNYRASHTIDTKLARNKSKKPCFYVIIDGGEPICISELRDDKKPLKILVSAFRKKGTMIYRSDLIEDGILSEEDRNKSLRSDIFKDNKHILNVDPLLLEMHSDRLMVKKSQKVTLNELNQLKTRLKIL